MLSTEDLERLITEKRRDIEQEKTSLGLSPGNNNVEENTISKSEKQVRVSRPRALSENNVPRNACPEENPHEDEIPPDLERYIRIVRSINGAEE